MTIDKASQEMAVELTKDHIDLVDKAIHAITCSKFPCLKAAMENNTGLPVQEGGFQAPFDQDTARSALASARKQYEFGGSFAQLNTCIERHKRPVTKAAVLEGQAALSSTVGVVARQDRHVET